MGPKKAPAKKKGGDGNENGGEMVCFCAFNENYRSESAVPVVIGC